jgi:hypothetical protein
VRRGWDDAWSAGRPSEAPIGTHGKPMGEAASRASVLFKWWRIIVIVWHTRAQSSRSKRPRNCVAGRFTFRGAWSFIATDSQGSARMQDRLILRVQMLLIPMDPFLTLPCQACGCRPSLSKPVFLCYVLRRLLARIVFCASTS